MQDKLQKLARGGLLTALALVLSLVDRMFPLQAVVPVPGIKLGLANVVTLFALTALDARQAIAILLCRVVLGAVFAGSVTSLLFSLLGGLAAFAVMWLLLHKEGSWFSLPGVSIAGAAAHNIGQIGAAVLVLGTVNVVAYLPLLLFSAIPMGLVAGLVCAATLTHLKKIRF